MQPIIISIEFLKLICKKCFSFIQNVDKTHTLNLIKNFSQLTRKGYTSWDFNNLGFDLACPSIPSLRPKMSCDSQQYYFFCKLTLIMYILFLRR